MICKLQAWSPTPTRSPATARSLITLGMGGGPKRPGCLDGRRGDQRGVPQRPRGRVGHQARARSPAAWRGSKGAAGPRAVRSAASGGPGRRRPRGLGHTHRHGPAYLLFLWGQFRRHVGPGRGRRLHPAATARRTAPVRERGSPARSASASASARSAARGRLAHGGAGEARRPRRLPTALVRCREISA